MPAIDYEKEYDNRARVPEHPEIFARWQREAKSYRAASPGAKIGLRYGKTQRQTIDLFPAVAEDAMTPLAMFIHGGWWRSLDPAMFSQIAKGPNAHGVTVAVIGYDLCPQVAIADIVVQVRQACLYLWQRYRKRIFAYGHSAGGHLTACMVTQSFKAFDLDAPEDLVPSGYAISGVFDLEPLLHVSQNADLKLDAESARALSPLYWDVPPGRRLDTVVGSLESSEFLRQSRAIAEAWSARGIETHYAEIAGADHFTVVDPLADHDSAMTRRIVQLANLAHAIEF
jgi:arylformamidase